MDMALYTSKFLPMLFYPLGLACILLVIALLTRRWPRWGRIAMLLALSILWIGGNHWVAKGLASSLEWRYPPLDTIPEVEVIVLLGGGTQAVEPPRPIVEINSAGDRVIYSAWLYHQGAAEHILVSGGRIPWQSSGISEASTPAQEMAYLLEMLGVPADAIWSEPNSFNTYENARFSKEILETQDIERILLVTSAMHMPRSVRLFEAQGLDVIPAPVDYHVTESDMKLSGQSWQSILLRLFPTADNLSQTTGVLKEYLGMMFYNLRGWE